MAGSPPHSKSRSRSREPAQAGGRGGFGNIHTGGLSEKAIEEMDESERASHQHAPGVYVLSYHFHFQYMKDHLTRPLSSLFLLGTRPAGEAQETLRLARYRTAKVPCTRMAPIIRMRLIATTPNPLVAAAAGISPAMPRANRGPRTLTMACQIYCTALLVDLRRVSPEAVALAVMENLSPEQRVATRQTVL